MERARQFGLILAFDSDCVAIELDDTGDELKVPAHLFKFALVLDDPVTLILGA